MKPWIKTGIFWALWMFTVMTFVFPYLVKLLLGNEDFIGHFWARGLINAVVFGLAGMYMGYRSHKKKERKQIDG